MKTVATTTEYSPRLSPSGQKRYLVVCTVAVVLLVTEGFAHRWLERAIDGPDTHAVKLKKPLSTLPLQIGEWHGREVPIDQRVIEVAGCDDHVNRFYTDTANGESLTLYIAYAARPARMISHRPQVCFPAHGWQPAGERIDQVRLTDGTTLKCLLQRFTRSDPTAQTVLVLNYYILQGRYTTEWTDFWGFKWRMPNLMENPDFYVAQVQISGVTGDTSRLEAMETTVKKFAAQVAPLVHGQLPGVSQGPISTR